MRKKSREMDAAFALQVFDEAPYATLSMVQADGMPYAVPISHARTDEHTFYFHCALVGEKLECIRKCPRVCLSAVSRCVPTVGPKDGSFTLQYVSAVAFGDACVVEDEAEKVVALKAISMRYLPQHMTAFEAAIERSLQRTAVVRITLVAPPTGKRKQYDAHGDEMKYGRME